MFRPTARDVDGISLFRAKVATAQVVVGARADRHDYVAVLRVGDLRNAGFTLRIDESPPHPPGHVTLTDLPYAAAPSPEEKTRRKEMMMQLANKLVIDLIDPYATEAPEP